MTAEQVHRLDLVLEDERARLVAASLAPEAADLGDDRSRTTLERDGTHLAIGIEAADLVALRAAANTWSGLLETAVATESAATPGY